MLNAGDKIGIIAPSSLPKEGGAKLPEVLKYVESLGYEPVMPEDIFGGDPYCANSIEARLSHIQDFVKDKSIKAIWALKGGYGATQLWPALAKVKLPAKAPLLIGYSDLTALHALWNAQGKASLHGSMLGEIIGGKQEDALPMILSGKRKELEHTLTPLNKAAESFSAASTHIMGGNMAIVQASLGTPTQLNVEGKVLLLEDVDEDTKRIDRMMHHIEQSGLLSKAKAILFGAFARVPFKDDAPGLEEALRLIGKRSALPVFYCPHIGHVNPNVPIMLGHKTAIKDGRLTQKL